MSIPYNPLDKMNLAQSIAEALLMRPVAGLAQTDGLIGAGVYALYYTGDFAPYASIAAQNLEGKFQQPIYVGKAVPKGSRKGGLNFGTASGYPLRGRLRHHATSIDQVDNLDLGDFHFRSLVVDDIWIPLGENMMIEMFKPIWNWVVDGFGNNKPGSGREKQCKSPWDVLHPGRRIARNLAESPYTQEVLTTRLQQYFAGTLDFKALEQVAEAEATSDET